MENTNVGPFKIIRQLGTRRQQVFHALQVEQSREVALKFIKIPPNVEWEKAVDKINREVAILKQLTHPNLVRVYGAGFHDERIFFAYELVEGESLASILARRGKLAPDQAMDFGYQIALLLEYLHNNNILHSKLTPEKILITRDNDVKVADLRLNRSKKRRWDSTKRRELDIAAYMAPEQFAEGSTHKSDFYGLGVIMYEMLTGHLPYEPDTMGRMARKKMNSPVPSVARDVFNCPVWLDKIVTQMLQPLPKDRPHSARAIIFAFDEIKKIDSTHQSAVVQMTGGFNPLNAGEDKTEAEALLMGRRRKTNNGLPFYQSIPFLLICLALIAITIGYAVSPPSDKQLYERAEVMMRSDNQRDWIEARGVLKTIMEGDGDEQLKQKASNKFYESKRRTLVRQAERGVFLVTQSKYALRFGEAVTAANDGNITKAKELYQLLIDQVSQDGEYQHIYTEARNRLDSIVAGARVELPADVEGLTALIEPTLEAKTPDELQLARSLLERIILRFEEKETLNETVQLAKTNLEIIQKRIEGEFVESPDADSSDINANPGQGIE